MDLASQWANSIACKTRQSLAYVQKQLVEKSLVINNHIQKNLEDKCRKEVEEAEKIKNEKNRQFYDKNGAEHESDEDSMMEEINYYERYDKANIEIILSGEKFLIDKNYKSRGYSHHNSILIKYIIQNESMYYALYNSSTAPNQQFPNNKICNRKKFEEWNAILLPRNVNIDISKVNLLLIKNIFPLKGNFLFRFKVQSLISSSKGHDNFFWLDINDNQQFVPNLFSREIHMKVLVLPPISNLCNSQASYFRPSITELHDSKECKNEASLKNSFIYDYEDSGFINTNNCPNYTKTEFYDHCVTQNIHTDTESYFSKSSLLDKVTAESLNEFHELDADSETHNIQKKGQIIDREYFIMKRLENTNERIQRAVKETQQRRDQEIQKLRTKLSTSTETKKQLDHWAKSADGKWKDIRTLLSTLHEVLWKGAEWDRVPLSSLMIDEAKVRKFYKSLSIFSWMLNIHIIKITIHVFVYAKESVIDCASR